MKGSPRNLRRLRWWPLILGLALVLGAGIAYGVRQLYPTAKVIPTTRVQRGTLELDINTPGELRTPRSAMLVAPSVNGVLQIVHLVKTGEQVKAGDVVVEFDPSEQEYNLAQSRSQLAEADQQIIKAKADAEVKAAEDKVALLKARFDVRRAELEVSKNELVSEIDARKNQLNLDEARRRIAQLELDINSRAVSNTAAIALLEEKRQTALLGMKQAQRNIDNMQVKSPIDGMVSIKENTDLGIMFYGMTLPQYREGDLVYPGNFLAEVMDLNKMEVVAHIYESDRSNLNVGQSAEVRLDGKPQEVFPAKVSAVAATASRANFGPNAIGRFEVSLAFLNRAGEFRPGTSAQIHVRGNQLKDQLYLPNQCLFEKDGKQIVYVKSGNSFQGTPAKIKFRTENRIVIEDLPEGTEVALVNPEEGIKQQKKAGSPLMGEGQ
jgi:multidrug efflux pump subunit AcrA (membrane-fusion protein)